MADAEATLRITAEVNQAISELTRLRQSYLEGNGTWTRSMKDVTDAMNRFSGDAIIRQAQTYVQAVQAMGGVTKLTSAEQANLNRVVTEAIQKYQALGQTAPKALTDIQKATQSSTKSSGSLFDSLFMKIAGGTTVGGVLANAIVGSFSKINDAIKGTTTAFLDLIQRGAKVSNITVGYDQLRAGINALSDDIIGKARVATKGLITDFDMMTAANRAMMFGLKVTNGQFATVAESAVKLGRAMGLEAGKALDDLVLALGRVSPRILDNLGIIVKVGDANTAWAAKMGKSVEKMTAQERVMAFTELAVKRMEEKLGTMGDMVLNAADRWLVLKNHFQNFLDKLGMGIARSPVLITLLERLGDAFTNAMGDKQSNLIDKVIWGVESLIIWVVKAAGRVLDFAIQFRQNWKMLELIGAELTMGFIKFIEVVTKGIATVSELSAKMQPWNQAAQLAAQSARAMAVSLGKTREEHEKNAVAIRAAMDGQDAWSRGTRNAQTFLANLGRELELSRGKKMKFVEQAAVMTDTVDEETEAIEENNKGLERLAAKLRNIEPTTRNIALVTKEYGSQIEDLTNKAILSKQQIPAAVAEWLKRVTEFKAKADLQEVLKDWEKFRQDLMAKGLDAQRDANRKRVDDEVKVSEKLKGVYEDYQAKLNESSEKGVTARLAKVEYERLQAMQKIGEMPPWWDANRKNWEQAADAINKHYGQVSKNVLEEDAKAKESMKRTFGKDLVTLFEEIPKIVQKGLTGGGGWKGIGEAVVSKIGATFAGGQVTNLLSGAFKSLFGKSVGDALGDKAGGLVGSIAKAIPGIGGAIGSLIGPLVGKIFKAISGPENWEKIAKDAGKNFGIKMSDALAKQIDADAKKFKMSNFAAEIFNLDKIIAEAGGLNSGNYNKFLGSLGEVFNLVKQGKMDSDKARETLDKNFGAFAKHLTDSGKLASKEFLAILDLNAKMGTQSKEIADFVTTQLGRAANALGQPLDSLIEKYGNLSKEIEELTKKESLSAEETERLVALQKLKAQGAEEAFGSVERAGALVLASFNAAIAKGVSWIDAINQVSPALDKIITLQKTLGIESGNAAVQELIRYRDLANQHKELVEEATSLNDALLAMSNIGALNTDTLKLMGTQASETFDKLINAGFTEREALMMQKGAIETLIQAHKDLGVPMDENTQRLVDAAREQGVLKDQGMSTNDILAQGLGSIIELLGGKLPEAFRKMRDGFREGASGAEEFRQRGESAGQAVEQAIVRVGDRARTIRDRLRETEIEAWAENAGDAINRLGDEVNRVTFGSSPGGLKEYVPKLRESLRAFHEFSTGAVKDLSKVADMTDEITLSGLTGYEESVRKMAGLGSDVPGIDINNEPVVETHVHVVGMDGRELNTFVRRSGQENFADRKWTVPQDVVLDIGARPY